MCKGLKISFKGAVSGEEVNKRDKARECENIQCEEERWTFNLTRF